MKTFTSEAILVSEARRLHADLRSDQSLDESSIAIGSSYD